MMLVMQAGTEKGREDAESVKTLMDKQLLSEDYSGWEWYVIEFIGPLQITTCGGVSPNVDLAGRELQRLHDVTSDAQWMTVNVVPREGGGSIVLGYLNANAAPRKFINDLARLPDRRLTQILPQFIFAYIENTYFSSAWWEELRETERIVIMRHAGNPNAYYDPPEYAETDLVSWTISARFFVRGSGVS